MAVQPVYPPFPYYGQAPMYGGYAHQIAYAPGAGIFGPPGALAAAPPPPAEAKKEKPLPPAPPATNVGSACSSQTTAAATAAPETTYGAPTLRPGINYLYPEKKEHTMLHIFSKASPIWEEKYAKCGQGFKMFKVSIAFTVKNVVERVTRKQAGDECKGWAATEVVERGGGGWEKVSGVAVLCLLCLSFFFGCLSRVFNRSLCDWNADDDFSGSRERRSSMTATRQRDLWRVWVGTRRGVRDFRRSGWLFTSLELRFFLGTREASETGIRRRAK
jgi:hypothetical protein